MRIAIVLDYSLDLIGGAQRAALNEAAALIGVGHEVLLVAPRPRRPVVPPGVRVLWTESPRLPVLDLALVADDDALRSRLTAAFRLEGIDAVHLHSEFGHAGAARAAARSLGLPVVHTVHTAYWPVVPLPARAAARTLLASLAGPVPARTGHALLDRTLATALAADVVVSPSAHQAADLRRLGVPDPVVLPNCGVADGRPALPLPDGPLKVAWIGRAVPEKRLPTFVRAVRRAQRRLPPDALRVAIVGDGPSLPVAKALAGGRRGLVLLGRLGAEQVRDVVDGAHLTALTSLGFDNQPMTVVESVRAGRGVLHVDPRLTEGLDRAGLLTASPDASGMADLLVELALDPARVVRAAAAARAAADLFAPSTHLARLLPLLRGSREAEDRSGAAA